ncbi:MAG: hypothetical protein LUC23_01650 [Prevotellaceae bacterium]|nr:hypothetical protein [Prevotellaceae bacterium]
MKRPVKEFIYPLAGFIIAIALFLAGIVCDSSWCLSAGIALFICTIGLAIACHLRNKRK